MENYYSYPCRQCGMCCRHVDFIKGMEIYDRGDGVCKNLGSNNKCGIYEHRPNLCNGKYVYERFYSDITVADFHRMIETYCKQIQSWRVEN